MTTTMETATNESLWAVTTKMPKCRPLRADVEVDVGIVGAGIAGLTTGYLLSEAGKSVAILDDGELASGMTQVTTAHLASALDDRYFEIERLHGAEGARLAAESHAAAIDCIESIAQREHIACDFARLDGYLFLGAGDKEETLDRELLAVQRVGLAGVVRLKHAPASGFNTGPCLHFPNQGQFHPLKYLAGLARAIKRLGGRIYTNTHADHVEGGEKARITAGGHTVSARAIVVATNTPINDLFAIHTKQAPYMSYVIGARVPPGAIARALYWDTEDPFHYIRLQSVRGSARAGRGGHDVLLVGGEDHKSGQAADTHDRHARLEAWARARFPMMEEIEYTWAGQVMETIDGLAFIGRNPLDADNVYIVTGDSGMGMTHGTIAGMLLRDLILGRENPWAKLYDPSRKTLGALGEFAREGLNMVAQYVDWVTPGDVGTEGEIANGQGAVLRRGLAKVAAYRDDHGVLHQISAVCPHLGCVVAWNAAEKTWDCPCHGSRFDKLGKVINGPANSNLEPAEWPRK